jgi:hypothetical protein
MWDVSRYRRLPMEGEDIVKWKKHNMLIKIFLVGMLATCVYKYMQSKGRVEEIIPPQLSETERPLANGRMEFWQADSHLDANISVDGNSAEAKAVAESFLAAMGASSEFKVYCMINANNYVLLVRSTGGLDEDRVWSMAREAVGASAKGVPTIGVGVRGSKKYHLVIVGGPEEEPILVKQNGPFTLYPYFYRAQGLKADD